MTADKKTDVWMPLWIGAYLADTMAFTTEQHGAYLLLILAYWRERAPLADDDDTLRGITKLDRADWKRMRPVLAKKFRVADGVWWHKRVEHEMAAADARSKKASEKAAKAAQARWQASGEQAPSNAPSMPQALREDVLEECPPPSPIPSIPSVQKVARKRADPTASIARPESVAESVWSDWLALRKAKKAPVTGTVLQNAEGEARKAGMTLEDFLRIWCARGSQGLQAEWLTARDRQSVAAPSETAYARQMREKYEQVCPDIAAKRPGATAPLTVDMEPSDAIAIR